MSTYEAERRERERNRVALMLADPNEIDLYLMDDADHFYVRSYWQDGKLYALFLLLTELRAAGEQLGYVNRLKDHGKKLLEQRKTVNNIDQLGA